MNRKKNIPGLNSRVLWGINPRTRIHDNDIRHNQKRLRRTGKKLSRQGAEES